MPRLRYPATHLEIRRERGIQPQSVCPSNRFELVADLDERIIANSLTDN